MGVETMIAAIEAEADAETDRLLAEADHRARAITDAAKAAVQARVTAACEHLEPGLRAEAARAVNAARLKLLERRAELAAERMAAIFEVAGERLDRIANAAGSASAAGPASGSGPASASEPSDAARWRRSLARLLAESLAMVGAGATITCRPADADVLRQTETTRDGRLTIEADDAVAPGLIACSANGRIEVEATISVRLARARQRLAEPVARAAGLEA